MVTDINSAELIKHAANSFLALKISYINALSAICEASGADIEKGADGIGADKRIGRSFLNAGLGYGGSCFPKDVAAFISISEQIGEPFPLLREVQRINQYQRKRFVNRLRDTLWILKEKRIAVWGLTFKPDTDDVRSSVAVDLVNDLIRDGAHVTAIRRETREYRSSICVPAFIWPTLLWTQSEMRRLWFLPLSGPILLLLTWLRYIGGCIRRSCSTEGICSTRIQ